MDELQGLGVLLRDLRDRKVAANAAAAAITKRAPAFADLAKFLPTNLDRLILFLTLVVGFLQLLVAMRTAPPTVTNINLNVNISPTVQTPASAKTVPELRSNHPCFCGSGKK